MPAAPATEVFGAFLRLGCTAFGGPLAHVALFRREFVERRRWLGQAQFDQLLALCQFLPGPASSQLGFALGLLRAGWRGALAAFIGFTLPSAALLTALAMLAPSMSGPIGVALLHGFGLAALCVVAFALVAMTRTLCPDGTRRLIAAAAAALVLVTATVQGQLLVVLLGACAGALLCPAVQPQPGGEWKLPYGARTGALLLLLTGFLLLALPLAAGSNGAPLLLRAAAAFYRTGALAFGGGHVVLPLLQDAVVAPGWVASGDFLAGYGAAQAVPGPMFALSAFLGARLQGGAGGGVGAAVALGAMFLPGLLIAAGVLPLWRALAAHPLAARAIAGVGAVVVGLLAAALYDPVWIGTVHAPVDALIGAAGFALLATRRVPVLAVVALCVAGSLAFS